MERLPFFSILQKWKEGEPNTDVLDAPPSTSPLKRKCEDSTEAEEAAVLVELELRLPSLQDQLRDLEIDLCD